MKLLKVIALGAVSAFAFALPASANNTGLAVTGTLSFGPNGSNLNQYWSPQDAVIGGGMEYNYADGANHDTADFTQDHLHIQDVVFTNANGWEMTFTTPGGFTGLSMVSSTFDPGLTYSLRGGMIVLDWNGTVAGANTFNAMFSVSTVPEPASYALLLAGLGLLGYIGRRKIGTGASSQAH